MYIVVYNVYACPIASQKDAPAMVSQEIWKTVWFLSSWSADLVLHCFRKRVFLDLA